MKAKKLFEIFRNTEGNCSIDFQCAGSVRGGKKIELLFSGLFSIFMPFELCVISIVYVCLYLLAAFECICSFRNGSGKERHSFPFAEVTAAGSNSNNP